MVIKNSEHFFYASDGSTLKGVGDFLNWLKNTSDESFNNHVNAEKNDFIGWVKIVLKDNTLGKKIEKTISRDEMIDAVEDRLFQKNKKSNTKKDLILKIKEAISNE